MKSLSSNFINFFKSKSILDFVYLVIIILIVTWLKDMVVFMYHKIKNKQWSTNTFSKAKQSGEAVKLMEGFTGAGVFPTTCGTINPPTATSIPSICDKLKFLLCNDNFEKLRRLLGGITIPQASSQASQVSFNIYTRSGSIFTHNGNINTGSGNIITSGGNIITGTLATSVNDGGNIITNGGSINTIGGGINTIGGGINTGIGTITSGGRINANGGINTGIGTITSGGRINANGGIDTGLSGTITSRGITVLSGGITVNLGSINVDSIINGGITSSGRIIANGGINTKNIYSKDTNGDINIYNDIVLHKDLRMDLNSPVYKNIDKTDAMKLKSPSAHGYVYRNGDEFRIHQ
jgi:hypothetical protein